MLNMIVEVFTPIPKQSIQRVKLLCELTALTVKLMLKNSASRREQKMRNIFYINNNEKKTKRKEKCGRKLKFS